MEKSSVDLYSTFDEPYPFKTAENKTPLLLYPVLFKNFFIFNHLVSVLTIDKNSIPDVSVIQMSYLNFLMSKNTEENNYMNILGMLLSLVLRDENIKFRYGYNSNGKAVIELNGVIYGQKDFDSIREIICYQNLVDLPDERVSKALRDKIEEARRLKSKSRGSRMGSLEDQIVAVSIATGISLSEIYNGTIRKFIKMLERVDHKIHYEIYLSASMSGFVKFKDKNFIKHWLVNLDKESDTDGLIEYSEFEKKFSGSVNN